MHEPADRSTEPTDEVLARRVQRGDRAALERLVARYLRPIQAVTASYLTERADIEDAVQETFLRALARIAGYQSARPFAPWLYQIARNVARDRAATNTRRRTEPLPDGQLEEPAAGPDLVLERSELRRHVAAAIRTLPQQQRTVFRSTACTQRCRSPRSTARIHSQRPRDVCISESKRRCRRKHAPRFVSGWKSTTGN